MYLAQKSQTLTFSIHSLVKRETKVPACIHTGASNFNPLPRKEET